MPIWIAQLVTIILKIIIPPILKEWGDAKELKDWRDAERAKIDAAAAKYKEDLKKAGDDEQAQKDAFDKLLNSTK